MRKHIRELLSIPQMYIDKAEKLAAKLGRGRREYIPDLLKKKIDADYEAWQTRIDGAYLIDSETYWKAAKMAESRGIPKRRYLEIASMEAIAEAWGEGTHFFTGENDKC